MNNKNAFIQAIEAVGLTPPSEIIDDGKLHRFSSDGRKGKENGWYVFHNSDIPAGVFGCWASLEKQAWQADIGRKLTEEESSAYRATIAALQKARAEAEAVKHEETAADCERLWAECHDATTDNAYLTTKQVQAYGVKESNGALVVL
jgi:putative DNA primase/helicase